MLYEDFNRLYSVLMQSHKIIIQLQVDLEIALFCKL